MNSEKRKEKIPREHKNIITVKQQYIVARARNIWKKMKQHNLKMIKSGILNITMMVVIRIIESGKSKQEKCEGEKLINKSEYGKQYIRKTRRINT